jgi:hypothetical protein
MLADRYTKLVLTVIAVCLTVLAFTELVPPAMVGQAEASSARPALSEYQEAPKPSAKSVAPTVPTSTLPLRWRIPTCAERTGSAETYCSTVISVRNLTDSSINVEVEWFNWDGTTSKLRPMTLPGQNLLQWATNNQIVLLPFFADDDATISSLIGYANVNANDPRILVTATILCRDGTAATSKIVSQNEVPAFPVGATAEFFQAGMPPGWTQPRALPDKPE